MEDLKPEIVKKMIRNAETAKSVFMCSCDHQGNFSIIIHGDTDILEKMIYEALSELASEAHPDAEIEYINSMHSAH